jgi:hypothetical protein
MFGFIVTDGLEPVSQVARAEYVYPIRRQERLEGKYRLYKNTEWGENGTMLHRCEKWGGLRRSILEKLERIKQRSIPFAVSGEENSTCVALREMADEPFVISYTVR